MRDPRHDRFAHNESHYREVNERIRSGQEPSGSLIAVMCECGNLECGAALSATAEEYERVRAHPAQFLLLPGHEMPETETVVERTARFVIPEKHPEVRDIVEARDPRSPGP